EGVEGLDRPRHRRMHLRAELAQRTRVERLVRHDDGQRRVPGRRLRESLLERSGERRPRPRLRLVEPTNDLAAPVDDGSVGVHDREDRDSRAADEPERRPLARRLPALEAERLSDRRRAPGAARPARKDARPRVPERTPAELLVRVDRVRAPSEVEDDRPVDDGDVVPGGAPAAAFEELRLHAARGFETVRGAAREADRVGDPGRADHPRRAAADVVHDLDAAAREVEDRAAGRALLVLGDPDLEAREVELELSHHRRPYATATSAARPALATTSSLFARSVRPPLRSCNRASTN